MALIFTESFDTGMSVAQMASSGKWTSQTGTMTIVAGRNGSCVTNSSGTASTLDKTFSSADAHGTYIVGFAHWLGSLSMTSQMLVNLHGDAGATLNVSMYFDFTSSIRTFKVYRGTSAGTLLGTTTVFAGTDKWYYVELKVTCSATVGTVDVRVDGVNVLSLTNQNTKLSTASSFDRVTIGGGIFDRHKYDDFYVCNGAGSTNNDFLGDVRVECLTPNGDGNYSQFTARTQVNRLPNVNTASIDTDATAWVAESGCTVTRSTSQTYNGSAGALSVAANAGAPVFKMVGGTGGAPVVAGNTYSCWAYFHGGVSRVVTYYFDWYDSGGVFLSRSSGMSSGSIMSIPYVPIGSGGGVLAPPSAAFAGIVCAISGTSNSGETYYVDYFAVVEGSVSGPYVNPGELPNALTAHFGTVNDLPRSAGGRGDETYVVSQTDDQIDTWTFSNLASSSTQPVKGVMAYAMARTDTPSAKSLALVCRLAGTDVASDALALPQTYSTISKAFETDPAAATWTVNNVNAAEFGVKLRP